MSALINPTASDPEMISRAAAAIRHWEQGNEQEYRSILAADCRMVIPAYGVDLKGIDSIWGLRKSMGEGILNIHAQHTAYVTGRTVVALSTVYSRESGAATQHAELKYTFNDEGRVSLYEQHILWKE